MMVAAGSIMAMAVVVTAVSTNAEDGHTRNRLGRRHRRLSLPSAPWSGEVSKAMSVSLTDPIDIWEDSEGYDNDENNEEGDDVIANIIGGELLQRGDRPYLVSLGNEKKNEYTHSCAGTLIESKAVLTAAHCFTDIYGDFSVLVSTIKINIFELDNTTGVISYPICEQEYGTGCDRNTFAYAQRHPRYTMNETVFLDNDFALVFIPNDITDITPVELNTDLTFPSDGDEMEIFGWGDTDGTGNMDLPNVPYTADVVIMPRDECTSLFDVDDGMVISENQVCTRNDGKATGAGDSGGPLIHIFPDGSSVQVGITSFGFISDTGASIGASVFSRISAALEWITSIVCGETGEWCDKNEDGNQCFRAAKTTSFNSDHVVSDFDVDLLPGFIEDRVESNNNVRRALLGSAVLTNLKKNSNLFENNFGVKEGAVRGAKATNSSLPYIVSIGLNYLENSTQIGHVCAGTLIRPDVILSAAHCFTDRYGHKTRLDWVDLAANASPSRIQLKKSNIWRHIKYNHTTRENDLALVFLDSKVNVQPVRLDDSSGYPLLSGVSLNVTGWGPKSLEGLYVDRQQTVTELYASNLNCSYPGISLDQMCTTSIAETVSDRCIGDSGSPVIVKTGQGPLQVGVTSLNACRARPTISPPCPSNMKLLTVSVLTDVFPEETSWTLTSVCSGQLEASVDKRTKYASKNKLYTDDYCVSDARYEFTIFDAYEDGLCCGSGDGYNGSYNITFDGRLVASGGEFMASETIQFGNPNGVCPLPLPNIHSRVSVGMEWINQAIQCRTGTKPKPSIPLKYVPKKTGNENARKKSGKAKKRQGS